jgi:hypothetical protein
MDNYRNNQLGTSPSRFCQSGFVWLTSLGPLASVMHVLIAAMRTGFNMRRAVSLVALLFVFFLPLHFHLSLTGQVAKECSCFHGTRTQLAPQVDAALIVPSLQVTLFAAHYAFTGADDWSTSQKVRGPPTSLSV